MLAARCDASEPLSPSPSDTFGSYVRALRVRAGFRIPEVAARIGLSSSHYNRIELDEKAPPAATRWPALVELGADPGVLSLLTLEFRTARERRKRSRHRHEREEITAGLPGSSSWDELAWEEDDWCWYAVTCHPGGLTIEEVAELTGLTSERVRQVEQEALAKLAVEPGAVEAMEVIDDRESELAIWTVAAKMR